MNNFNKLVKDIQKSLINETIKTKYKNVICEEQEVKLSEICKYLKRLANYYRNGAIDNKSNKRYKKDIQNLLTSDRDARGRLFNNIDIIYHDKDKTDEQDLTCIDILEHWFDGDYILEIAYTAGVFQSQWNKPAKTSLQQFLDLPGSAYDFVWALYEKSDIHNPILRR